MPRNKNPIFSLKFQNKKGAKERGITLSKPGSHPCEQKVEERYWRSCLNRNPNFKTLGSTNIVLRSSYTEQNGTARRSTRKTSDSSLPGNSDGGRCAMRQAIWRRVTAGNDGDAGVGLEDRWEGFHSASRATMEELWSAHRRSENSGESQEVTRWVGTATGDGDSIQKLMP